ncbi:MULTISPECIES: zinc-dependent alcohol dehydrogenase family protein [Francisella]|uniref:Zinc-binding alcohol dehydrogenase family protein n=1 Tax=Francisella opportunistica TaxID=2016517 RepID=A0A345JRH5_9GAMM|nr:MULTISPECIES: zinc-dependent alcohol dehydrogenase family protein [Francisella]APC91650.1 Alcohol dehydrogenase [Francisella sp. MA067296]AXH29921.1 zinc-binding alcohol dehydrogenase family protein [Francisella opportunistica]AXH31568.1 zinc-binding alcohol dehydrogenase family protein [Francisella opportunistica]AXH33216.1 zinc-binding alcohol dehydrogenase family protein [Francisella opportunistica]
MKAMILEKIGVPLRLVDLPTPEFNENQLLIKIINCGICRTDLHIIDGELNDPKLPLIPGHQIVGKVAKIGSLVKKFKLGDIVGVPWLGGVCSNCFYCKNNLENLCDKAVYTGYQINGGYAEYCVANSDFCFPMPFDYAPDQVAPLLCAGLIGYRALRKTLDAEKIGFYGFGASAHILTQLCKYQGKSVYAFTKTGDIKSQYFAKELGAIWSGSIAETPNVLLDAAIIFAPDGYLVPLALKHIRKGGIVVCAGIHMSDIPSFPYKDLWGERKIVSVANLTRQDGIEFLEIAPKIPIKTVVTHYKLYQANEALEDLRNGKFEGAAVLDINPTFDN